MALGLRGVLFAGVSLFSLALRSGMYTLAAGVVCCACAARLGWKLRAGKKQESGMRS